MQHPFFFGYGSLVNTATHDYADPLPARVKGWRRCWRHTRLRDLAFLSVVPDETAETEGLIARVPGNDWSALDVREAAYRRVPVPTDRIDHNGSPGLQIHIYHTRADHDVMPSVKHPILLSYIDVVVQGFHNVFGEDGVERFFATTEGWDAPILDDRPIPRYTRYQKLTSEQTEMVDHHLSQLSAKVQKL